jgi:hypothetical protein
MKRRKKEKMSICLTILNCTIWLNGVEKLLEKHFKEFIRGCSQITFLKSGRGKFV